jgi:hypothetical protein
MWENYAGEGVRKRKGERIEVKRFKSGKIVQGDGVWNRKEERIEVKGLNVGKLCKEKECGTGRGR